MTSVELLRVSNLKTHFQTEKGTIKAVDGASFRINKGETLGLAGESGSGKTTVAFSILRLIPELVRTTSGFLSADVYSKGTIVDGEVLFQGRDLLRLSDEEMRQVRGKEISMVFQNPIPAMNPLEIIGYQVGEPRAAHEKEARNRIREMVFDYLGKVDLAEAKRRYYHNPHEFSGGEAQRIMIAMALICNPSLLIADEPTSSLDVTIQRQVLQLLKKMKKEFDLSMLYITHDLGVIAEMSDRVAVMYAGKIMENGDVTTIFKQPSHPYTKGLIAATPSIFSKRTQIEGIPGEPLNPLAPITGCRFHPRCRYATDNCRKEEPQPLEIEPEHFVACSRTHDIPHS